MTRPAPRLRGLPLCAAWLGLLAGCGDPPAAPPQAARHVGSARCAECHAGEHGKWLGSHHELAMKPATGESVLGDFDDAAFTAFGVTSRFRTRDGKRYVTTDGPDGALREYEVLYTFGWEPLQQYLVDLGRGRLQALSLAWATREQRWFHLNQAESSMRAGDPLHWTGAFYNWNHTCAECHSTDLRTRYDEATDSYATSWAEVHVGCEACHGPGSGHDAWARQRASGGPSGPDDPLRGFAFRLKGGEPAVQVDLCGRCHARRDALGAEYVHGRPLADTHAPSLLVAPLYHADGRIHDEVYEHGSFVQTKKFRAGVRCTDCHDPHTARPRERGDALCLTCHRADPPARFPALAGREADYASPAHHHHAPGGPGSRCVDCHMPTTTYMVVHPRHDHGFRVPRPDVSARIAAEHGADLAPPDACTGCHAKEGAAWAAAAIERWFPHTTPRPAHFAEAFAAARAGRREAASPLVDLARDPERAGIVRATALAELARFPAPPTLAALADALRDADPLVRAAAATALDDALPRAPSGDAASARARLLAPLLADPVRSVRVAAAGGLTMLPPERIDPGLRAARELAIAELARRTADFADRPEEWHNRAARAEDRGETAEAERLYRRALRAAPWFAPSRHNLANLLDARGDAAGAEAVLRELVRWWPESGEAHYSLGLVLAERRTWKEAAEALARAQSLLPRAPRVGYNLGLVREAAGDPSGAESAWRAALLAAPDEPDLLWVLGRLLAAQGRREEAARIRDRLLAVAPGHPGGLDLAALLGAAPR